MQDTLEPLGIDCGPRNYILAGLPVDEGWVEFDASTLTISVFPTSGFHRGTHEMTLSVDLANYPLLTPKIGLEIPFEITVSSTCGSTEFYFRETPKMFHIIGNKPTRTRVGMSDKVSSTDGGNGFSLCGQRTYSVSPSEYLWFDEPISYLSILHLNGAYPEFVSYAQFGDIQNDLMANITVGLEEYPDMPTQDFNFTVYVLRECEKAGVLLLHQKSIRYYTVGSPRVTDVVTGGQTDYALLLELWGFKNQENVCGPVLNTIVTCKEFDESTLSARKCEEKYPSFFSYEKDDELSGTMSFYTEDE